VVWKFGICCAIQGDGKIFDMQRSEGAIEQMFFDGGECGEGHGWKKV
jgi:hypothetical protein